MKVRILLICLPLVLFSSGSYAQNKGQSLENIVALSRNIKRYEKDNWGVNPGNFATKIPKDKPITQYLVLAQSKFKLAHNYLKADVHKELNNAPGQNQLKEVFDKDFSVRTVSLAGTEEITLDLINVSLAGQIFTILHEDFHAYGALPRKLRSIEESFGTALGHLAAIEIAGNLFHDRRLKTKLEEYAELRAERYLVINSCYEDLDNLYRSSVLREKKLRDREVIFRKYELMLILSGWDELNNAVLSDAITYSRYYFYAVEKIEKFGIQRFIQAYVDTASNSREHLWPKKILGFWRVFKKPRTSEQEEKNWLKKFERELSKTTPNPN